MVVVFPASMWAMMPILRTLFRSYGPYLSFFAIALKADGPVWRRRPLEYTQVWEAMSKDVLTVRADETIGKAASIMLTGGVTGLPVLEDDRLVGMLTTSDLTRFLSEQGDPSKKVREYMCREVTLAKPLYSVNKVIRMLLGSPSRRIIIVDVGNRPIGIITPTDLAFIRIQSGKRVVYDEEAPKRPTKYLGVSCASDFMSRPLYFTSDEASIVDAASTMVSARIGGLPVLNRKRGLCGLFSKIEVLKIVEELEA